jgi:hypothetical protein
LLICVSLHFEEPHANSVRSEMPAQAFAAIQ